MRSQLTVRLPEDLEERLTAYAGRLRLKRSQVLRMALERFFSDGAPPNEPTGPYERVRDLVGCLESGVPDLGTSHREHLVTRMKRRA